MAISTIYFRHKTPHGWRYSALGIGRRSEAARNGPFFIRVRDGANKYKWQKHDTENAAKKAAERAPVARKAQELGLLPDDVTNETNKDRVPIKTAVENYLNERRFGRPRSIKAYENVFDQLLANLPALEYYERQFSSSRLHIQLLAECVNKYWSLAVASTPFAFRQPGTLKRKLDELGAQPTLFPRHVMRIVV